MKLRKKIVVSRYGFPRKIKIVNPSAGRPKKKRMVKVDAFEAFCEWAAKPTPLREDKHAQDFGRRWGISDQTLVRWKKRQDFWEKVAEWRMQWAKDKTSDVVHGLFKRASTRGEAAEVKLWMQLIEDWSEKTPAQAPNITVIGIKGLSSNILDKLKESPGTVEDVQPIQEVKAPES
jgi:hypothetical protein